MMNICEIIASHDDGGLENHFVALCNALSSKGHNISVIVPPLFSGTFDKRITIYRIALDKNRRNPTLLWHLYKTIHDIAPDIIHAHASKSVSALSIIKPFLKYPIVATIHNIKRRLHSYNKMDGVIGVSKGVLASLAHSNSKVIYHGLQLDSPIPKNEIVTKYQHSKTRPIVLAIGRLVEAKNFHLLIKSWQGINADLLIIGDGPLKAELGSQIKSLQLESSIHLLGFVENASSLIPTSDLIVISSNREGFNYVMAEALLQSKPVLSTDVPAPNEILPKKYLTPINNNIEMHRKLQYCLSNLDAVNNDYKELYLWAKTAFSIESMTSSTEKFFINVISQFHGNK